jgi:NADH dehydrogenase/putative oxidoreductase
MLAPWLMLVVRLWLAKVFIVAGVQQMMGRAFGAPLMLGWQTALWQDLTGSDLGIAVQAICPLLLAVGLFTRPAGAALLLQTLFSPFAGAGQDLRLFWVGLLVSLIVYGAGPLSLDRLLRRGAESSAIPGVTVAGRWFDLITQRAGPPFLAALRIWLATAPARLALAMLGLAPLARLDVTLWLPRVPPMISMLPAWTSLLLAVLLILGLAARPAAFALLLLVPLSQLHSNDARLYWALLLAIVTVRGPGCLSLDQLIGDALSAARRAMPATASLPHVVVVGGGFGGVSTVRGLRRAPCRVTLIDRRNYHLFQPLLYQVATASLAPGEIATPIRELFREQSNVRVVLGEVSDVDVPAKAVTLTRGRVGYDYLVVATGAQHSYFGRDDWAQLAPGLKSIDDATAIRGRLLRAFEEAENADSDKERDAWLTFVIVGGGPTGVELAGAIAELALHGLERDFRMIDPVRARIVLVQSGPRLLPTFPETLSLEAERTLRQLGVDVRLDRRVEHVAAEHVVVSGVVLPTRTVLWAAGVRASPAAAWLGVSSDRAGRVPVNPDMSVEGCEGVFAIGDTAASRGWRGELVPGLAPAAKQSGAYVARMIRARLTGSPLPLSFRYRHMGSLATIGRQAAVADFGLVRLKGAIAWWLWGAAHVAFLVGGRNRAAVLLNWVWAYLTFRRSARLITGTD